MNDYRNIKYILIGIGVITIVITGAAMLMGRSTDGWWGIFMGVVLLGTAFSLNEKSEKS